MTNKNGLSHSNFQSIIYLAGFFGIVIREQIQSLVYHGRYNNVSANLTLSKLEKQHGLLKRIDRGKRKTDGYKLTEAGIKCYRELFGAEPKNYSSGDKLSHSIQIGNFYCYLMDDMLHRGIIQNEIDIMKDHKLIKFDVQKQIKFMGDKDIVDFIPDAFVFYRYDIQNRKAMPFFLEIENSDRRANSIAVKTIKNYEGYFISRLWEKERWQPAQGRKFFPRILIVTYSEHKMIELIRWFKKKARLNLPYIFANYQDLKEHGISGEVWHDIEFNKLRIFK
jgi:hypothetical protein